MKARITIPRKLRKQFVARRKSVARKLGSAIDTSSKKVGSAYDTGAKKVGKAMNAGSKKLAKAEKSGALARWKTRVGLGLQAVEVATVALALVKGRKLARSARAKRTRRTTSKSR